MRLINTSTLQMAEFEGEAKIPRYAILSHTWEKDEYLFRDRLDLEAQQKAGYIKVKRCCDQALKDGHEWLWADICCIDKSSSAELSEAINSMFLWYQNARVCYAYLSDVSGDIDIDREPNKFKNARWFTRGWTLQELLAPSIVVFFTKDWQYLGTSHQLDDLISQATNIDRKTLRTGNLQQVCVARKMSWAAHRETTRVEDLAYCLLGIFDVNMPLLYGEGRKAFVRLQLEILRVSTDQSLFAWGVQPMIEEIDPRGKEAAEQHRNLCTPFRQHDMCERPSYHTDIVHGLLAASPADFAHCYNITEKHPWPLHSASVNSSGVQLRLLILPEASHIECHVQMRFIKMSPVIALLACHLEGDPHRAIGLLLVPWTHGSYGRMLQPILVPTPDEITLHKMLIRPQDFRPRIAEILRIDKGSDLSVEDMLQIMKEVVVKRNIAMDLWLDPEESNYFAAGSRRLQDAINPPLKSAGGLGYNYIQEDCIPSARYTYHQLEPSRDVEGPQATLTFQGENKPPFAVIIGQEFDRYKQNYLWSKVVLLMSNIISETGQMTKENLHNALLKGQRFGEDAIMIQPGWILSSFILGGPDDLRTLFVGAVPTSLQ